MFGKSVVFFFFYEGWIGGGKIGWKLIGYLFGFIEIK